MPALALNLLLLMFLLFMRAYLQGYDPMMEKLVKLKGMEVSYASDGDASLQGVAGE